jgi:hypothetical protein
MNFDDVTGIFNCTPTVSDIRSTVYLLHLYAQDEFVAETGYSFYTFNVYIYANRAPVHNSSFLFPNLSYKAGYPFTISYGANAFYDPEEQVITYNNTYSVDMSSWLPFNTTTLTYTGTPHANDNVGVYWIYINADDPNVNSATTTKSFSLTIEYNNPPMLDGGFGADPTNVTVYFPFSYTLPADAFKEPDGDTYTFTVAVVPNNWSVVYNSADRTINGTLNDNTKYGLYNLSFTLTDQFGVSRVENLGLEYYQNQPPNIVTNASTPSAIIAHYALDYSVPKSYYTDPEGEDINFSFRVNDTTSVGSWVTMSQNATYIRFQGTPLNYQKGQLILSIVVKDNHTDTGETLDDVLLTVNENQVPYLAGTPTAPSSQIVGYPWSYDFDFIWLNDHENETISHTCSFSPADVWMT